MSWTAFKAALRKDLLRQLQDPLALTLWVGIPLVIGTLVTLAMGGQAGARPKAKIWISDEDDSFLSTLLVRALAGQGSSGVIAAEEVEEQVGQERIEEGDGSALLIIPDGFGSALLAEQPTKLHLITNPAQRILPGIVREMLEIFADGTFYLQRVFGKEIRNLAEVSAEDSHPSAAEVAELSVLIHGIVERVEKLIFPPAIQLEMNVQEEEEEKSTRENLAILFLPGVVIMALFFAAQGMSEQIWRERSQGILRRMCSTPLSVVLYLCARCCACAVVLLALSVFGLGVGMLYHNLPFGRLFPAAVWSALTGSMFLSLMTFLQLLARSQRAGSILTNTVLFPLLLIGGSFMPLAALPESMAVIGRHTPNGWASQVLGELLMGRGGVSLLAQSTLILMAIGAPVFLLSAQRLRKGFAQGG